MDQRENKGSQQGDPESLHLKPLDDTAQYEQEQSIDYESKNSESEQINRQSQEN